jgi:hypothetical protein
MAITKATVWAPEPKDTPQVRKRRADLLKEVEDEVNARLGIAPLKPGGSVNEWKGRERLRDLVLYQQMNRLGVRTSRKN